MNELELLRGFIPQPIKFGSDDAASNYCWSADNDIYSTWFFTRELRIQVLFVPNPDWGCMELQFKTALRSKPQMPVSLLRDPDLPNDANRATHIFRHVVYIALSILQQFHRVGFNGAHPALDQIYGRLSRLGYVKALMEQYGFVIRKQGRDVFLERR